MKYSILIGCIAFLLNSCFTIDKPKIAFPEEDISKRLHFVGSCSIPYDFRIKDTWVGGLSGIDYDKTNGKYYAISDDRSNHNPARFYELEFDFTGKFNVKVTDIHYFKTIKDQYYPNARQNPHFTPDFESIRCYGRDKMLWTTEGERRIVADKTKNVFINPMIYIGDKFGRTIDSIVCPIQFYSSAKEFGIRKNAGFEAMDIIPQDNLLVVTSEVGLVQDKTPTSQKDFVRIVYYDTKTKKILHQYACQLGEGDYSAEPFSFNGISELLCLDQNNILLLERAYSPSWKDNKIKLYHVTFNTATDVKDWQSLNEKEFKPATKKLVLDFATLGITLDNLEGISFGKTLPNGNRTLIVMSDNNFSKEQKTQFLLFELKMKN